ncbi:DNA-entry nuclease [Liquorilactobacillus cacaonum]|nr:DNA-entry nuclease [Liquorilactobacillus cacaonum]
MFLNFIRQHNYITLLIISALLLGFLPGNFVLNIARVSFILFVIFLITFIVSKTRKHSVSRFNFKKIMLGILVIFATAIFVDVAKGGPEASSHSSEALTSQVKNTSSNSKKEKKANELAKKKAESLSRKKESLKEAKAESKAESESAASESASIASSASESESIASSMSESSSVAASVASSQSISASISASSSYVAAVSSSAAASSRAAISKATATTNTGGNLYTGTSGKIIGNSRSHIYHVPGQAGYHMNSANAVYFNTEADAQAAGYRKSLR